VETSEITRPKMQLGLSSNTPAKSELNPLQQAILYEMTNVNEARKGTSRAWRFVYFLLVVVIILIIGIVYLALAPRHIPLLVVLQPDGTAVNVGDVSALQGRRMNIPDEVLKKELRLFFTEIFSLPTDINYYRDKVDKYFTYLVTDTSAARVTEELRRLNVTEDVGILNYRAKVEYLHNIQGDAWQVDYVREFISGAGRVESVRKYRAIITVESGLPSANVIDFNPLGIIIKSFSVQEIAND
jgi:type IV secretory pathway TrbF-like protein